ncbi:hypothetical protein T439DRAFT_355256 [Meredithblackwellia eburnea MCA 4105]
MSLVPRIRPAEPVKQRESIQAKLARLRREDRAALRPALRTQTHRPSAITGIPHWQLATAQQQVAEASASGRDPGWSKLAGPPPPPSWAANDQPTHLRAPPDPRAHAKWIQDRRKLLSALDDEQHPGEQKSRIPTLAECCCRSIARDLDVSKPEESIYLPHLHLLPFHLRQAIINNAPIWNPLREAALRELLAEEEEQEQDEEASQVEDWDWDAGEEAAKESWEKEDQYGWELLFQDKLTLSSSISIILTTLNLAYSSISTKALRSLLLRDSISHSTSDAKPVPLFPNLSTLLLAGTENMPFTQNFIDLFKPLISIRHLSIAGKTLRETSIPLEAILPRLSSATPTLIVLDLSYTLFAGSDILILGLDWETRWKNLRKLGVKTEGPKVQDRAKRLWEGIRAKDGRRNERLCMVATGVLSSLPQELQNLVEEWTLVQRQQASSAFFCDSKLSFSTKRSPESSLETPEELKDPLHPVVRHLSSPTVLSSLDGLKVVGGLDISFREEGGDGNDAIAVLAVLSWPDMKLIHHISRAVKLTAPYIPSFLSFREAADFSSLLTDCRQGGLAVPQVLFVDGNGRLHPREAGAAVAVGLGTAIPTLGVAKDYHPPFELAKDPPSKTVADGAEPYPPDFRDSQKGMRQACRHLLQKRGDWIGILDERNSKFIGAVRISSSVAATVDVLRDELTASTAQEQALRASPDPASTNAIFVSPGHLLSLETSLELALGSCTNSRVPEPIRQADAIGRREARELWGVKKA